MRESGHLSNNTCFSIITRCSGTTDDSGVEIKFRLELEFLITKIYEKDGVRLPMISKEYYLLNVSLLCYSI